jgi:ribosome-associated translation inhibitor RaiA
MNIDIQARDFQLTEALESHIRRRLDFALSPRYEQIQQIQVRLGDINGPRGGADKCCHLHIVLPRLPDVVVDDTELDMYLAINRAIDRAGRAVSRRLSRQRVRSQRPTRVAQAELLPDDMATQQNLMQA